MALKGLAKTLTKERKAAGKPPAEQFLASLDKIILELDKERGDQPQNRIRPSGIHKCERSIWYALKGFPMEKKKYPRVIRIVDVGTAHHEYIQNFILRQLVDKRHGIRVILPDEMEAMLPKGVIRNKVNAKEGDNTYAETETRFIDTRITTDILVTGSCDATLELDFIPNEVTLFEYKTINEADFNTLIQPQKKHILQGGFYCYGFGARKVLFLYENKNKQEFKAFVYEYTDEQIAWVEKKITKLDAWYQTGELPPMNPFDEKECQYCEYKYACNLNMTEIPAKAPATKGRSKAATPVEPADDGDYTF